jgi:HK97 gp10 family phage protein
MSERASRLKVDILGADEVALLFKNIDLISEETLDEAAYAGAEIVKRDAKARAPVDTGDLQNSIDILRKEKSKDPKKKAAYQIGPRYKSKKNPDGVNYGLLVEFGHTTKSGKTVPAKPYLRPAIDNNRGKVMSVVLQKFYDALGRL